MENKPPLLHIRPNFSSFVAILESLIVSLVGIMMLTFVGGIILLALFSFIGLGRFISGSTIFATLFIFGLVVLPPLYYEIKRKACKNTFYNFYDNYVEFQRFQYMINRRTGRIGYRDIINVVENANFIQQREKLTSVYLFAPDIALAMNGEFPGLKMTDIPQSRAQIKRIFSLIEQGNNPQTAPSATTPSPLPEKEPTVQSGVQTG